MSQPTEITVRPTSFPAARDKELIFGVRTPGDTDNITAREVLSGLNPLHHIPFVSQLYETAQEGPTSPAVSVGKLIGGALLGGPIGFFASLANVIFEQQTGTTMLAAATNAITGEEATTQVAQAESTSGPMPVSSMRGVETPTQEILPPEAKPDELAATEAAHNAQMHMASAMRDIGKPYDPKDSDILSLFGGQPASAHQSYKKAQMLPYLQDVTSSQVI